MKRPPFGIDLRASLLYALLGGAWILLSDRLLLSLAKDPALLTRLQTYKGWAFVLGSALLIFVLLRADLIKRDRSEAALQEREERFRSIAERISDVVSVWDERFRITYVSPSATRVLGYTPEEIVAGRTPPDFFHPESLAALEDRRERIVAGAVPEIERLEVRVRRGDGNWVWLDLEATPIRANGRFRGLQVIGRDITERKLAEEALSRSVRSYRGIFNAATDAIFVHDADTGTILDVNDAVVQLFGYDRAEALTLTADMSSLGTKPYSAAEAQAWMAKAIAEGPQLFEWQGRKKSGDLFWVEVALRRAEIDGQQRVLALVRDITERKRAEQQLTLQRDLGIALGNSRDLAETLRLCTEAGSAASGLECGGVYLLDQASGLFEMTYHRGCSEEFVRAARQFAPATPPGRVLLEGQSIYANFRDLPEREAEAGRREGLKALAICPIRQHNRVIGSLNLASRVHESVPEYARHALETIAGQISQAIARDRTLAALQASERSYREIFNGADDAIFVHDAVTGAIVDANASMRSLYGFGDDDLSRLGLDDVSLGTSPYSAVEGTRLLARAAAEGPQRFEWMARRKDGGLFWVEVALKSAEIDGQPRLLALVRDISQRKRAEEALARERHFTDAVLDSVPGLLYLYDEEGRLVRWNRRHEEMTGYSGRELAGRYLLDWFEGEHRAQVARGILRGGRSGHTEVEASLRTKDGRQVPFLFTAVPLVIDGRQYVTGIGLDVTERRRAEEELHQLRQELAHVGRALTLGELGTSIAHELGQPLTTILSNAQAARRFLDRDPPDLQEVRRALTDIESADVHARDVIRRLRDFIDRKEVPRELVDLNQSIRDVLRLVRAEAASRDTMTIAQLALDLPLVSGDRVALQQVLLNFVVNALDAVQMVPPTERQVAVRSRREADGMVAVTVSDTGQGLAPPLRERLFEPFFTTKPGGLGLGLSLSRSLIEAHDGQVWAAPHPEGGMIFGFRLPIARDSGPTA